MVKLETLAALHIVAFSISLYNRYCVQSSADNNTAQIIKYRGQPKLRFWFSLYILASLQFSRGKVVCTTGILFCLALHLSCGFSSQ